MHTKLDIYVFAYDIKLRLLRKNKTLKEDTILKICFRYSVSLVWSVICFFMLCRWYSCRFPITPRVPLVEQELLCLFFRRSCVHLCVLWGSCCSIFCFLCSIFSTIAFLFVSLFYWPLYCQSFELRFQITPFVIFKLLLFIIQ